MGGLRADRGGRRWVREDEPSIDAKERALAEVPDLTFWMVLDDVGVEASRPLVVNWTPADVRAKANVRAGVVAADTLAELAVRAGIDADGLQDTVARYNAMVDARCDPDFGRTHLPAAIETPPFYALENHGIALISFAGLNADADLRIRRADGAVFTNLYGIGEVIGSRPVHGFSYLSGMTVTPAITFGRLLGAGSRRTVSGRGRGCGAPDGPRPRRPCGRRNEHTGPGRDRGVGAPRPASGPPRPTRPRA